MQTYRADGEVDRLRASSDPLLRFTERVTREHGITREELERIDAEVRAQLDVDVDAAKAAPQPPREALFTDVYVSY